MNTLEIQQALRQLNVKHTGVYPADRVPKVWTRSSAIVANTDDHKRPGEHWVAFFLDENGKGTYFDSYGIPPLHPGFLLRLRHNSKIHRWNIQQLQGVFSQTCGHYSCVFLYYLSIGYDLNQFLALFTGNCEHNDRLIVQLFRKIFLHGKKKHSKYLRRGVIAKF